MIFDVELNNLKFSGSNQHLVSQFVNITKIKGRDFAEKLLKSADWNLESLITWFVQHKDDDEYKEALKTENECKIQKFKTQEIHLRKKD